MWVLALMHSFFAFISMMIHITGHSFLLVIKGLYNSGRYGWLSIRAIKGPIVIDNPDGSQATIKFPYCFIRSIFWTGAACIGAAIAWGFGGLTYALTWGIIRTFLH
jgi:hypothetical protein